MKKKLLAAAILIGFAAVSHAAIGVTVKINGGTLQPGTTEGINLSSGTILNVNEDTTTIRKTLTMPTTSTATFNGNVSIASGSVTNLTVTASTMARANINGLTGILNSALNANGFQINNVSTPTAGTDAPRFHNVGIVQVQQYSVTSASNTAATGSGYVNTHLTGSFTPQFSDSRIIIFVFQPMWTANDGTLYLRVARGGSAIDTQCQTVYQNGTNNGYGTACMQTELSPGTSAVTYTTQMRTASVTGGTCDGTNACKQSMVIMEVNTK